MIFIDNDQLLLECCQRLSQEELIAVDTEFMRDTNSLLLCLIQLAINDEVYIIDVLQCNLAPLVGIFSNEKILKVFHAARQDLECLWNAGISVINCYDTQMYEMLLDIKQDISYRQIVLKYCNKAVSKQEKRSDWSARPLSHAQLCYSANDVFYLRKVYLHQLHQLTQVGRLNWLEDDMVRLNDLIRQQPLSTDKQPHKLHIVSYNDKLMLSALKLLRDVCGVNHNICPHLLATKEELKQIIISPNEARCFGGWRYEVFGREVERLLNEGLMLQVNGGRIKCR